VENGWLAPRPGEKGTRGIDRDALLLLLEESVKEKRVLEGLALLAADCLHALELAIGQRSGVGVESPEEGGLAVVHVTDDDDGQAIDACGGDARRRGYLYPSLRSS